MQVNDKCEERDNQAAQRRRMCPKRSIFHPFIPFFSPYIVCNVDAWSRNGLCAVTTACHVTSKKIFCHTHPLPWKEDFWFITFWTIREKKDINLWMQRPVLTGWVNEPLPWNTVSTLMHPLWENIFSSCWPFAAYLFLCFRLHIQFALHRLIQVIKTTYCGPVWIIVCGSIFMWVFGYSD